MQDEGYREKICNTLSGSDQPVEDRISSALELGKEYLRLPIGFFTRIDDSEQRIVQAAGEHPAIQPGKTCPLEDAYCRQTITTESTLAMHNVGDSTVPSQSAVEMFGLEAYIGARIIVDRETYGTICFADTQSRERPFTEAEKYFVELAARLIGQVLEQQAYERDLREREQQVREGEALHRAVVSASFDLVVRIDTDGRFTFVSDNIEELLGYPQSWLLGKSFTAVLPDDETIATAEEIYESAVAGETVVKEMLPIKHQSGKQVPMDLRVTPLHSGGASDVQTTGGDVIGVQAMLRDASDRQDQQRMIRILNRVLRHNLRNDMNVISGYAEMLHDRLDGEEARYTQKIIEKTEQLRSISETARKLEINIKTPPEVTPTDVVPLLERTCEQVASEHPAATVTITTPKLAISKSAPRLETAIRELVENAAIHAGESPSVHLSIQKKDDKTYIHIEDDGPGLPEQDRAALRSKEETPLEHGSGLGLWLVNWIIESLNGQLTVESCETGARIEIELQRAQTGSSHGQV